jgi:hypothetical protein
MLKVANKTIVFVGRLKHMPRLKAIELARKLGASIQPALNASTHIVVAGIGAELKIKAAKKLGIKVIDEKTWNGIVETSPKTKQIELSLWGWGLDIEQAKLTKRQAERFMRKGVGFDEACDMLESFVGAPTDCILTCDGDEVRHLVAEPNNNASKRVGDGNYYLVKEEGQKGEWGRLIVNGGYDPAKLSVAMGTDSLNGNEWVTFSIDYDGKEFEYIGTDTNVGPDFYVIKPNGEKEEVEVLYDC